MPGNLNTGTADVTTPRTAPRQLENLHSVRSDVDMVNALLDFYVRNPEVLGGSDILTIMDGKPPARAGQIAAVLAGIGIEGGERAIQKFLIIVPTTTDPEEARSRAWEQFRRFVEQLAGKAPTAEQEV